MARLGDQFISVKEALDAHPISHGTIWDWLRKGLLTSHKFPGDQQTYIERRQLEAVLANRPKRGPKPKASGQAS